MRISIADIEDGRALIFDLGAAFFLFFGTEAVFVEEKALFTLSFDGCADSDLLKNGLRLYADMPCGSIRSHIDLTISGCNDGIVFTAEAMHDAFLNVKLPCGAPLEGINEGSENFSMHLSKENSLILSARGSCSIENERIKLRRGISKFILIHDGIQCVGNDDCRCFEREAHKCNELIFGGDELSESSPLLPWLVLSDRLKYGHFDIRLAERLSRTARNLPKKEMASALEVIGRYLRAFGERPMLKPSMSQIKHLTNTELLYARSIT